MARFVIIKKNYEFGRVYRRGKRYITGTLSLQILPRSNIQGNRVGFAVARGYRTSVRRNRLKRLARAAYAEVADKCLTGYDIIITMKSPEILPTYANVLADLKKAMIKAGLFKPTMD